MLIENWSYMEKSSGWVETILLLAERRGTTLSAD